MAPKEDLNLPEGDQNEAKDAESSVETVEPAATIEEESAMAAEINLVTEKGTTSAEETQQSETKNIAAEISALLDASEENEDVLETEDAVLSASITLRKRLTKGTSEEENPGRRDSCFLTEIDENADDEVFNPEEVVKNIGSIDNYLENKENDSEQKEDIQLENQEETSMDEIENIGMIEDDKIEPSKVELQDITQVNDDASLTEPIVLTEEEKPCEEQHTPASIVDTILAAARRSASVEQSTQEVMDEAPNDEHTVSMTLDSENTVITEPAEAADKIATATQESKKDDVPIELIEAATTIVDTIIEKAKLVVTEGAGQSAVSENDKDLTEAITVTVDNENIEDEESAPIEETTKVSESTTIEDSLPKEEETHEAHVSVGDLVENPTAIEQEATEDPRYIEEVIICPVQSAELVEDSAPMENSVLVEERVKDPIGNEKAEVNDLVHEDVKIEDIVIEAATAETDAIEEISVEPTTDALPEEALNTIVVVELVDNTEPAEEDYEDPIETTESHFIDDIKKEFNDVFVESELIGNNQGNIVTSTDKPRNMLDSLPLGELALATLVIFLALILFNY